NSACIDNEARYNQARQYGFSEKMSFLPGTSYSDSYISNKRVFDLVKDFGTSQSTKINSIFDSLLCPDRPVYVTIPYCTSTASCSCTTPS
ncbi:MAG: hypothetical protein KZQ66_01095, partial [Candidatus Thiodiazotropha sp. (ex Lucinoma aequizonata)]|nr:hypothetical protein [Candidatus Thiodiazotropha sp. (ex Lucinoma aequizonata)]MCU7899300.1 hypothetical protein [Candidatus Thiodiazotropha sp. (ex Lucinoma aequizonata)]MCU7900780.1 hypothetical protein [Candidatus Thiodiazotropha sp. (ex Lucinoma aequizonata)]MCU7911737.1 hypothetical protein [Candidatus Thiodiazotropha sp. (ex Lucinoma aequizonata)]